MTSDEYADRFEELFHFAKGEWETERKKMAEAICALVDAYKTDDERNQVLCTLPLEVHLTIERARMIHEAKA